jgi:hypothetical protein
MSAGPSRDCDNNRKYENGYQKRKQAVKRKESEVLQQGLLNFLKPANTEEETSLSDESKHSEILSEDSASSSPTPSCLLDDDPGKWPSNLSDNMRIF